MNDSIDLWYHHLLKIRTRGSYAHAGPPIPARENSSRAATAASKPLRTWNESDFSWLILGMLHHHRRWSKEALIVWAMGFNWISVWFRYESELDVLNEYQRQMIHWFKHFNSTKKITNLFQPNYQLLVILELRPSLGDVLSAGINYGPALSRSEALRGDTSFASIWLHHRSLSLRHPRYTIIL